MGIEVKDVRFGYTRGNDVLKSMTFHCADNRVTGIIGPNGAGKTTVLKIITGYLKPHSGQVLYDGRETLDLSPVELARLRGVVEQSVYTPFSFPVYDYVMLGRMPYHTGFSHETEEDHEIVLSSLKSTNALQFKDRKITELSGGELQRVMIARALAQRPKYLMLDEPISHLDIRQQLEVMKLLKELSMSTTVMCIIHEINQAAAYCDDVVMTRGGYVTAEGPAEDVLNYEELEKVFDVIAIQNQDASTGRKQFFFTLPPENTEGAGRRVHVISGDGRGRRAILMLKSAGFSVSAGILGRGDSDCEACISAGIEAVMVEPYAPFTDADIMKMKKLCDESDVVVLAAVSAGMGNLPNLEAAYSYLKSGKEVIFFDPVHLNGIIDNTGGRASEIYEAMMSGAKVVHSEDELISELI